MNFSRTDEAVRLKLTGNAGGSAKARNKQLNKVKNRRKFIVKAITKKQKAEYAAKALIFAKSITKLPNGVTYTVFRRVDGNE